MVLIERGVVKGTKKRGLKHIVHANIQLHDPNQDSNGVTYGGEESTWVHDWEE